HRSTQHVVAMGNTLTLEDLKKDTDSMIHTSQEEQTDALLLILYGTHSIMEICKQRAHLSDDYKNAADDLETIVLQIYADNFNDFFKRSVEPVNVVGEMDPLLAEQRKQEMWDRHPGSAEPAAYKLQPNGTLLEIPMDELPEDFSPFIRISTPAEVEESAFVLGEIPLLSGLQGPIGEIVDVL
ncbi:MAG: hypothetical protein KAQ65_03280, partial [Candidatus Thorarchaeota archaeon]|nr:hypothetical protein [Candidatus Thorarchaeota archaeon]